jgi:stage V sporulation protein R
VHRFEGKPLVKDFIANTMLGIEYLWGAPVQLETSEVVPAAPSQARLPIPGLPVPRETAAQAREIEWQRVRYTMKDRKLSKENI